MDPKKGNSHGGHAHPLQATEEVGHISDARLLWSVAINQLLTVGQVIAGYISGSVALLSDAAHNFNDANALLIAYVARRVSRKQANERYTFGYRRAELIGALVNLTLLAAIGLYLIYEGINRLFQPVEIIGWLMAAAAALALVIDVATALLLWSMSRGSLNVRAAFIHNLVDALGSIGVLIGAGAVIWLDWTWVDPALTLMIAGYVLWQAATMLPKAAQVLMEGAPEDRDLNEIVDRLEKFEGVNQVHHVHLWQLDEQHCALEAHVVVEDHDLHQLETIKQSIKTCLANDYDIHHSTLEVELPAVANNPDHDDSRIGGDD